MTRDVVRFAAAAVALGLPLGSVPAAGAYPDKPIRFIVSFRRRQLGCDGAHRAGRLEKQLGQPVVIENKPGAGAMIGIDAGREVGARRLHHRARRAGAFGTNLAMGEKMPYDPQKDIVPVTALAARRSSWRRRRRSRQVAARHHRAGEERPRQACHRHGGNGTGMHLTAEMINRWPAPRSHWFRIAAWRRS